MLDLLLLNLPCCTCLVFFFMYMIRKDKSLSYKLFTTFIFLVTILSFEHAQFLSSYEDYDTLVLSMFLQYITTPLSPLIGILYMMTLANHKIKPWVIVLCAVVPIVVGVCCMTIYLMIGLDNLALYLKSIQDYAFMPCNNENSHYVTFEMVCVNGYNIILWVECMVLMGYILNGILTSEVTIKDYVKFYIGKGTLNPFQVQGATFIVVILLNMGRTLLTRNFFVEHPVFTDVYCVALSMSFFLFFIFGLYTHKRNLHMDFILAPVSGDAYKITASNLSKYQQDKRSVLLEQFEHVMNTHKPYLNSNLRLDELAVTLKTNRQYLSNLINQEYKQNFSSYIRSLRVKEAQQYMLGNPHATLDEVAAKCGFTNTQLLCRHFKDETGKTPTDWLEENSL